MRNLPDQWIRADDAWPAIVEIEAFRAAQELILQRSEKLSDDEMLEKLRALVGRHGRSSGILIDEEEEMPSSSAFRHRFGSLVKAYSLIGYSPHLD